MSEGAPADTSRGLSHKGIRIGIDVGGTFTDLLADDGGPTPSMHKYPTTPADPVEGVLGVLQLAAESRRESLSRYLSQVQLAVHATTRPINAILQGLTAKTALLTTQGHPDILVFREGGRKGPFDFSRPYPDPYIPRALTFEVPERITAEGEVIRPLEDDQLHAIADRLAAIGVEAIAVCLLWSIANPDHELRVETLLNERLPDVPVTLSHRVNPTLREYRRASSAAIDASLKPLMHKYLFGLESRLRDAGLSGELYMVTSTGAVAAASAVAARPIDAVNSGPSMAPVAGRHFALQSGADTAIVADTGGTSFDVSLVRSGEIPRTRESWIGDVYYGHMTGLSAVDVRSIGAGGGSIAWVDDGGLLHVGPQSAGSEPGPACYGRGGVAPTLTDACLVLGYLDPEYFLGGTMPLDNAAARTAIEAGVAGGLRMSVEEAAASVVRLATDHMVRAIEDVTVSQGLDPAKSALIAGGGAAGLTAVAIATRLGCTSLIVPPTAAVLSAAGSLLSDLQIEVQRHLVTRTADFAFDRVAKLLAELESDCARFLDAGSAARGNVRTELTVEARYPDQVWELEVAVGSGRFRNPDDVAAFERSFHLLHQKVFAISDPGSEVEIVGWRANGIRELAPAGITANTNDDAPASKHQGDSEDGPTWRQVRFGESGSGRCRVFKGDALRPGQQLVGPAVIETPVTTVILDPGARAHRSLDGSILIEPPRGPEGTVRSARPDSGGREATTYV